MTNMDPRMRADADEARATLYRLADQVGVRCAHCGRVIHGHAAIGAVSYMAPMGSDDFQARPYCVPCAGEAMRE